jgi:hypothetical protein
VDITTLIFLAIAAYASFKLYGAIQRFVNPRDNTALSVGGRHSQRELISIVDSVILPAFARPEVDSFNYVTGGLLGPLDLPVIQKRLGHAYNAYFDQNVPGTLTVDRMR